ncbi:MAG: MBL fold metallo-hydrolase RNA specificity domain-containing protein, partial [Mucilaginibacter sp.]
SAHADQAELLRWLGEFTVKPKRVYLVHGEQQAMDTLRVKSKDVLEMDATIMKQDQLQFLFQIDDVTNLQESDGKNINLNV